MPAPHLDSRLPTELTSALRTFTMAELEKWLSRRAVRTSMARGELTRVLPGRYAASTHAESTLVRAHAACEAVGGPLTGNAALSAWGLPARDAGTVLVSATPGARAPAAPWLRLIRNGPARAQAHWHEVPVAPPCVAAVDAYATAREPSVEILLAALRSGLATPDALDHLLSKRTRMRGRAAAFRATRAFRAGQHSFLEMEASERVFVGPPFDRLIRQHRISACGHRYVLDAFDPVAMVAFETDGATFHATASAHLSDVRRDAELGTLGIVTVRFAYRDVMERPEWCTAIARRIIARRAGGHGSSVVAT